MKLQRGSRQALVAKEKPLVGARRLLGDVRQLIEAARDQVAQGVNATLTLVYWQVGDRIGREILKAKRADYGEQIVQTLSAQLVTEYGRGFGRRNLFQMVRMAEVFPKLPNVQTLATQLTWSHFVEIVRLDDPLKRDFYAEMCRMERWSVRTLCKKIGSMLFERTALSKKPVKLIKQELAQLRKDNRLTPDLVFRDPYFLDFLGLKDSYAEKDVEAAILRELEAFVLELGGDFTFVARQKRIIIDGKDYYLDLLFFHRGLRRLVAIDLKLEAFQAGDKGQMELYLRWLEKHEQRPDEESPLGLILCAGKTTEHVELLSLENSGIRVAEYLTELPPRALLARKLRKAVILARENLTRRRLATR